MVLMVQASICRLSFGLVWLYITLCVIYVLLYVLPSFFPHTFRYGEGWDFGEVARNGRGVNASQANLYGSGIGR